MPKPRTPSEIAEEVRKMVAGEDVVFADLFAADGVLTFPFPIPGEPPELRGREAIRQYSPSVDAMRQLFVIEGADAVVRETDDPEVVVTEITHYGQSKVTGGPYRSLSLDVIRVRDGEIVRYDHHFDPILVSRLTGHAKELAAAIAGS